MASAVKLMRRPEARKKVIGQNRNVFHPPRSGARRIFTTFNLKTDPDETFLFLLLCQIAIGRAITRNRAPTAREPTGRNFLLQHAAIWLAVQRQSPSHRKSAASIRGLQQTHLGHRRAGKRALDCPNLALHERPDQGRTIDVTNGSFGAFLLWIARATTSFPVPVSPSTSAGQRPFARRSIFSKTSLVRCE
jgi:hypothetical protein